MKKKTIAIRTGGGLGDLILNYFNREDFRLLEPIKKKFPKKYNTRIVMGNHCTTADELLRYNPYIDEIVVLLKGKRTKEEKENFYKIHSKNTLHPSEIAQKYNIDLGNPKLYLSNSEERQARELINKKPTIVVHPFAGLSTRSCMKHNGKYPSFSNIQYKKVLKMLASKGYRVIILGKSESIIPDRSQNEIINIKDKNIINLTDSISARLSIKLISKATGFIGMHSSMLVAAWIYKIPNVFFHPDTNLDGSNRRLGREKTNKVCIFELNAPWTSYFERPMFEFEDIKPEKVVNNLEKVIKRRAK